jgi:TetR/AcrR family transcriptional regulator
MAQKSPADHDPQAEATAQGRQAILAVAKIQFAEQGYHGATLSKIAAQAEVSKANIFHHFGSKEGLYLAVLRDYCEQLSPLPEERSLSALSCVEQLQQFTRIHLENMLKEPGAVQLFLRELLAQDPLRKEILAKGVFEDNFARLVQVVREGQAAGEIHRHIDPALLAVILLGADVFFFMARDVLRHFRDVVFADIPGMYSEALSDILLRGCVVNRDQSILETEGRQ